MVTDNGGLNQGPEREVETTMASVEKRPSSRYRAVIIERWRERHSPAAQPATGR
jgi:hypothetical protein